MNLYCRINSSAETRSTINSLQPRQSETIQRQLPQSPSDTVRRIQTNQEAFTSSSGKLYNLLTFSLIVMNYCRRRTKYFLRISESLTGDPGERKTRRKINTIILPPRNQDHFDTTTMVNHIFLWLWFYEILLRFASRIIWTIEHNSKTEDAGKLINIKFWERKYF